MKSTIVPAYKLVTKAYRQHLGPMWKLPASRAVAFACKKGSLFDKWYAVFKANDFEQLCELILLEAFKDCLPDKLVIDLTEQKICSLTKAAMLANEYVLMPFH